MTKAVRAHPAGIPAQGIRSSSVYKLTVTCVQPVPKGAEGLHCLCEGMFKIHCDEVFQK